MTDYGLRGTPSMLLVDLLGVLRANHFGEVADLVLGAQIAGLMAANADVPTPAQTATEETSCNEHVSDWNAHLPKIHPFWKTAILGTRKYQGSALDIHQGIPVLGLAPKRSFGPSVDPLQSW